LISFIVAMDENRVIGKENQLPWHLPADLKFFKQVTMGHPIVMGRKTHESIGRVLPGRENIVISRNPVYHAQGCTILNSVEEFLKLSRARDDEFFVIGGAEIFKAVFPYVDRLYITLIHERFSGDTYFPEFTIKDWELVSIQKGTKDEKNPYDFDFRIYKRKH